MLLQAESQFFHPRRAWIPFFVLLLGLVITAVATVYVHRTTAQRNESRFDHAVEEVRNDITAPMDVCIGYLRAGAGLFARGPLLETAANQDVAPTGAPSPSAMPKGERKELRRPRVAKNRGCGAMAV